MVKHNDLRKRNPNQGMKGKGKIRALALDGLRKGGLSQKNIKMLANQPVKAVKRVFSSLLQLLFSMLGAILRFKKGSNNKRDAGGIEYYLRRPAESILTITLIVIFMVTYPKMILAMASEDRVLELYKERGMYIVGFEGKKVALSHPSVKLQNDTCHFMEYGIGSSLSPYWEERCITPLNQASPTHTKCWCTAPGYTIRVGLGHSSGHRVKRSLMKHPDDHRQTTVGAEYIQQRVMDRDFWKVEQWVRANIVIVVLLAWMAYEKTKSVAYTTVLVVILGFIGSAYADVGCVGVDSRDVLHAPRSSTWVDVVLEENRCVQIVAEEKPTLILTLEGIQVNDLELDRTVGTKCEAKAYKSDDGCPGGKEAGLDEEHQEGWVCRRGTHNRGWGNGCGLFGLGTVVTCAQLECSAGAEIYNIDQNQISYSGTISIQDGKAVSGSQVNGQNFIMSVGKEDQTFDMQDHGEVRLICDPKPYADYSNHQLIYLLDSGKGHEVSIDWVSDLQLPWKYTGGIWKRLGSMTAWERPDTISIPVDVLADQEASLEDALHGTRLVDVEKDNETVLIRATSGRMRCRVELGDVKIKGRTMHECEGGATFMKNPEITNFRTVMVQVTYDGSDMPCRLRTAVSSDPDHMKKDRGVILINNPIAESNDPMYLEFKVFPGEAWIKVQDVKKHWTQKGSVVVDSFTSTLEGVQRFVKLGSTWDFRSVGELIKSLPKYIHEGVVGVANTLFGGSSTVYLVVFGAFAVWLGTQQRALKYQLLFLILGGSIMLGATGVLGHSAGCAVDFSRGRLSCGYNGEFVWKDMHRLVDPAFRAVNDVDPETALGKALAKHKKQKTYVAGTNILEYKFLVSLGTALKKQLANLGVEINLEILPSERKFVREDSVDGMTPVEVTDASGFYGYLPRFFSPKVEENGTTLVICETGHPQFSKAKNRLIVNLEVQRYAQGLVDTAYVEVMEERTESCPVAFTGVVAKSGRALHTSENMWMVSSAPLNGKGNGNLTYVEMNAYTECIWPSSYTIGEEVEESKLLLPRGLGGPNTMYNTLKGYATQVKSPWHKVPLTMQVGYCHVDDKITVTSNCTKRGYAQKSDEQHRSWCCLNCTLPPLKFETADGCYYAMEIRSTGMDAEATDYFFNALYDGTSAHARRKLVWSKRHESNEGELRAAWGVDAQKVTLTTVNNKLNKVLSVINGMENRLKTIEESTGVKMDTADIKNSFKEELDILANIDVGNAELNELLSNLSIGVGTFSDKLTEIKELVEKEEGARDENLMAEVVKAIRHLNW
uniref:Polyprotein n=1 Tax=Sea-firefly flavivirus TaxID=3004162 RepID=A0A9C7GWS9_9FLAV|nr:polyprotein [Sea-firefly flavivirus]